MDSKFLNQVKIFFYFETFHMGMYSFDWTAPISTGFEDYLLLRDLSTFKLKVFFHALGCNTFSGFNLFGIGGKSARENANGKDLNRDFPKQFDERQDVNFQTLLRGRQPETQ